MGQALTSVQGVWDKPVDQRAKGLPVKFNGILTYNDPDWGLAFFEDSTGGIYVAGKIATENLVPGFQQTLEGVTASNGITNAVVRSTTTPATLTPRKIGLYEITNSTGGTVSLETRGVVRAADLQNNRLVIDIWDDLAAQVQVLHFPSNKFSSPG
jgi:hypothetical protein